MDLTYAACWIATEGGKVSFFYREKEFWRSAFDKLLPTVASGEIEVIGRQNGGLPAPIMGTLFASITAHDEVRLNLMWGKSPTSGVGAVGMMSGEHGVDELWVGDRYFPAYSYLQVRKKHVFKLWPFEFQPGSVQDRGAGAPQSHAPCGARIHDLAWTRTLLSQTLTDEARYLFDWLKKNHPGAPPLKRKTIKNRMASV